MIARVHFVGGRERVKFLNLDEKALDAWSVLDHAANAGVDEAIEDGELVLRGQNGSLAILETGDERSVVPATYRFQPKPGKEYEVVIVFGEKDKIPGAALPLHLAKLGSDEFTLRGPTRDVMEAVNFFPARRAIGWARKGEQRRQHTAWQAMTADGRLVILKEGFSPPKPWQPMVVEIIERTGMLFVLPVALPPEEAMAAEGEIVLRANVEAELEADEYLGATERPRCSLRLGIRIQCGHEYQGSAGLDATAAEGVASDQNPEIKKWRDRGMNPPQLVIERANVRLLDVKAAFERLIR